MSPPVFISYARETSRTYAEALQRRLGASVAFLDTTDVKAGERFPRVLLEALLEARVVVIFADEAYFRSWYCVWEFRAAIAALLALEPNASEEAREAALASLVIALPPRAGSPLDLQQLPPPVRLTHWPSAEESDSLAQLVRARLARAGPKVRERLQQAGGSRAEVFLSEEAMLPPPLRLAGFRPLYPVERLPSLGTSFVGRAEELWRIHCTLFTLQGSAIGATFTGGSLEGGGGFGKTRLALEYVHRLGPRCYPGGIFWVDADVSVERLEEQLHGILRALRPGEIPDLTAFREEGRSAAGELSLALHEAAAKGPILYVVDNVPETAPDADAPSLETWCPALGTVALLVTSRARLLGVEGLQSIPVDALAPEAAVALLTQGLRTGAKEEAAWHVITEWVGYLPLALELLNRALRAGAIQPTELLAKAQRDEPVRELDRQREVLRRHVPAKALRGVTEALQVSYERLTDAEQRAARLVAWLAPGPVPLPVFEALVPEEERTAVRTTLEVRHFIRHVEEGGIAMLGSMHRVLADFLRSQSTEPETELGEVCDALLSVMTLERCGAPHEWPLMDACLPHAEKVYARMRGHAPAQVEREVTLGLRLGNLLSTRGFLPQAVRIERDLVERARGGLGPEHRDTLAAMTNLATSLQAVDEPLEALTVQQEALRISVRVNGEEHSTTLQMKNQLAAILSARGELSQARNIQLQVLESYRHQLGEGHPDSLSAMGNHAETLFWLGETRSAIELLEEALEISQRTYGEQHHTTLTLMGNLAVLLNQLGTDHERALELQERVLGELRRNLGNEHPDTLTAMNTLGSTLRDLERLDEARRLQEEALEGRRRILGETHHLTLTTKNNLSLTLSAQGELSRARALLEEVIAVRRKTLGDEHLETLSARNNLAQLLQDQGELLAAQVLLAEVLEISLRVHGIEHPQTRSFMQELAVMRWRQGDRTGACSLLEECLDACRGALGEGHQDTRGTTWLLYCMLDEMGEHAAAQKVIAYYLDQPAEMLEQIRQGIRELLRPLLHPSRG